MLMFVYSLALTLGLAAAAPWWGWRMLTSGRYREGLAGRLGRVPAALRAACAGKRVVWVHAVSVGEVLAVTRLVEELRTALGSEWVVAISTTTATGQKIARDRLGAATAFWFPLDFGFAVKAYLHALRPELLVLVESELWPRLLWECERAGVPVAVVNARVSDRSLARTMRVQSLWLSMAGRVTLWLAQGQETAGRLKALGIQADRVVTPGNLKYDAGEAKVTLMAACLLSVARGTRLVVAGSTLAGEEALLLAAWDQISERGVATTLVLAPRHPERFGEVEQLLLKRPGETQVMLASEGNFSRWERAGGGVVLLDTLGDLAGVYSAADVAFIGGSLVPKGGHNPLEAGRFGVPVVMGPSYENFREIVEGLRAAKAIRITGPEGLAEALTWALQDGGPMGERGRLYSESQAGATQRTLAALLELLDA